MKSEETVKLISSTSYTLSEDDLNKTLVFTATTGLTVTVPYGIKNWNGKIKMDYYGTNTNIMTLAVNSPKTRYFITELNTSGIPYTPPDPTTGLEIHGKFYYDTITSPANFQLQITEAVLSFSDNSLFLKAIAGFYTPPS